MGSFWLNFAQMTESVGIQYLENHLPFVQIVYGLRGYSISNILSYYEDNPVFRKRFNDDIGTFDIVKTLPT